MAQDLTVWDATAAAPARTGLVYCWNGYAELPGVHSVLRYVETHSERLRNRYLEWIHDLGEARPRGKRLIDELSLGGGLSYWWLSSLVEKSPWKTPSIVDAIRLLAVEEIILEHRPGTVRLASANRRLQQSFEILCRNLKVRFERCALPGGPAPRRTWKDFYHRLPQQVQGLAGFARYLWLRWPLRRSGPPTAWVGGESARFFCSYFVHLDQKAAREGRFHSRQWESLPQLVADGGRFVNWLQHFEPHGMVPDARVANESLRRFNESGAGKAGHAFVESFLTIPMVFRVLAGWLHFNLLHWKLKSVSREFQPRGSQASLWPLMRQDWDAALCGPPALINLLWIELFDRALAATPRQPQGLYLYEGQGWERAFVHAWRKQGHGQLIGVAHSTIRFWDLRYFCDPRSLEPSGPCPLPQPDLMALNGKVAVDAYERVGFPRASIAESEAVRYTYLCNLPSRVPTGLKATGPLNVLVLGDIFRASTHSVLALLNAAVAAMSVRPVCTVKPHPNCDVDVRDYPTLQAHIVSNPLAEILQKFDVAIAAKLTSAAVDAYLAGLSVVVMLDGSELNFSPLRGLPGVSFVSTPEELARVLSATDGAPERAIASDNFFFLDPELPRWKRLLEMSGSSARVH